MADKIRVGIVGANARQGSWGSRAHIPALASLPEYELVAVCTAHEDTAREAAAAFGAPHAFHDYHAMVQHPDVDLVSVAVRVPYHHEIVMAAIGAGKDIYCEWPLGANVREAEEMTNGARERNLKTMVGLQGRSDPALNYVRDLIQQGYVGDMLTVSLTSFGGGALERPSDRAWGADRTKGANTLTIQGGHAIDALCFVAGEFVEVAGKVVTQVKQWRITDTGTNVDVTSPDNVLVSGVLDNGAMASVHVAAVPFNASGYKIEIYGREGTIYVMGGGNANIGPSRVVAAKGADPVVELTVPDEYNLVPEGTPKGPPYNVAQAFERFSDTFNGNGAVVDPDFALALRRHRLLEAMERASAEGRTVSVS